MKHSWPAIRGTTSVIPVRLPALAGVVVWARISAARKQAAAIDIVTQIDIEGRWSSLPTAITGIIRAISARYTPLRSVSLALKMCTETRVAPRNRYQRRIAGVCTERIEPESAPPTVRSRIGMISSSETKQFAQCVRPSAVDLPPRTKIGRFAYLDTSFGHWFITIGRYPWCRSAVL